MRPTSSVTHAWRCRDWVIRAFNDDKPFNRFVQEQIAGDLVRYHERGGINPLTRACDG